MLLPYKTNKRQHESGWLGSGEPLDFDPCSASQCKCWLHGLFPSRFTLPYVMVCVLSYKQLCINMVPTKASHCDTVFVNIMRIRPVLP